MWFEVFGAISDYITTTWKRPKKQKSGQQKSPDGGTDFGFNLGLPDRDGNTENSPTPGVTLPPIKMC